MTGDAFLRWGTPVLTRLVAGLARSLSRNQRLLRRAEKLIGQVEDQRAALRAGSSGGLRVVAGRLRQQRTSGAHAAELRGSAFALVAESCALATGLELRPVQLIAAVGLSDERIVEMATGEGKTLAALPAIFLASLDGRGVHVVTANGYLAERDAAQAEAVLGPLGVSVGVVSAGMTRRQRASAYRCDVTYLTNKEAAADFLRDQLKLTPADQVQRGLATVIVDEADSILIDEARTPLIISGASEVPDERPERADAIARGLGAVSDFEVIAEDQRCALTSEGYDRVGAALDVDLTSDDGLEWLHLIERALTARHLYDRDREYLVEGGRVVLVDSFTGRKLPRRRLRGGLHRALEIKEGVRGRDEQQTLASVSYQSFFRQYQSLSGMTGTATSAAGEFYACYGREVLVVPRHQPCARVDEPDRVFPLAGARWRAVVEAVAEAHAAGQPVLVGTRTVADSELLATMLAAEEIDHVVLNARQDAHEAEIISRAGEVGAVTIATNMAGRGTDIRLGAGAAERGGLLVIGTARHDARRIDDQLRGRAGRQGEPGRSQFYVSLEDELFALRGGPAWDRWRDRLISGAITVDDRGLRRYVTERQRLQEGRHLAGRKRLLQYDAILEAQRLLVAEVRQGLLAGEGVVEAFHDWLEAEAGDEAALAARRGALMELRDRAGESAFVETLRDAMLHAIDAHWRRHLVRAERLREAMRYEGGGRKDRVTLYRLRCFELFDEMLGELRRSAIEAALASRCADPCEPSGSP